MLQYLKEYENDITYTENGAMTLQSSGSACLDLFGTIGALRYAEKDDIIQRFSTAYQENPNLAMKILFFARDVRGGLGERRVFRIILNWLADTHPKSVLNNLSQIAEYGRYDDLLCLWDTLCQKAMIELVKKQIETDLQAMRETQSVSLLAKWMPSVNASNKETNRMGKRMARALGMKEVEYRKILSALRRYLKIIENNLREQDYTFDYEKQPSKALFKYHEAFWRNDGERYQQFLDSVSDGKSILHTSTLMPYEVIRPLFDMRMWSVKTDLSEQQKVALNTTWNALEDYTCGENAMVVVDGSGSMYDNHQGLPITVALSLGIYFAERNTGVFHNHFMTFSTMPRLIPIKGSDIAEKVHYCAGFGQAANTNLQSVFQLILKTAVEHRVPQEELPETLYIISDMEFDACVTNNNLTNFEKAKKTFAAAGYRLPRVVFWNVASRNIQKPVKMHETGTALISGCSPRIFSMLVNKKMNPYDYMMDILNAERYAPIAA